MAAAPCALSNAPLFSVPWGIIRTPEGECRPVYDFSLHMKLAGSSDYAPLPCGGHPFGNIVRSIPIPEDLKENMGLVIGKDGKSFIYMTQQSGAIAMWHPKGTDSIWVIAGPTPYRHSEDAHKPGVFLPPAEDEFQPGDEYLHPDDGWAEFSYECDTRVIDDAVQRIHKQFEYARGIVAKNKGAKLYTAVHPPHLTCHSGAGYPALP